MDNEEKKQVQKVQCERLLENINKSDHGAKLDDEVKLKLFLLLKSEIE